MLSLVASALAFNVGGGILPSTPRAQVSMDIKYINANSVKGKLPESVDMAGAIPMVVGSSGKVSGPATTMLLPEHGTGFKSDFVATYSSLGEQLGLSVTGGKVVPTAALGEVKSMESGVVYGK